MIASAYDLKEFYALKSGRALRRLIRGVILSVWPEAKAQRVMGCGYAAPYMRPYLNQAERVILQNPAGMDAHHWPPEDKNLVCLGHETHMPIETNSIDRLLVIHGLEFSESPADSFNEYWRVLKSNGKLLLIVPNRMGLWSRADWTPFGHGTPYSASQIEKFVRAQGFVIENKKTALFTPPLFRGLLLKASDTFEKILGFICPAFGGLHVIEMSKQVYALTGRKEPVRQTANAKPRLNTQPRPISRKSL